MFKRIVPLVVALALLVPCLLVPASAATVKSPYIYTDGQVTWTDGVYNRYTLEIPLEHFMINVLRHSDNTQVGFVYNKDNCRVTVDMEAGALYSVIFSLAPGYPILMDGLPSEAKFNVEWEFYDNIPGYGTPTTHAFVDFYSGSNVGSNNKKVCQHFWDVDLDGTGHYAIEPLEWGDSIMRDEFNASADSFCFGFSFRFLMPFESGKYTFYLNSVKFHIYMPASSDIVNMPVKPTPPEGSDIVTDVGSKEDELLQSGAAGRDEFNNMLGSAAGSLENYIGSFAFLSACMNPVIDIPWIKEVLTISLGLGLTGFILNLGVSAISKAVKDKSSGKGGKNNSSKGGG